MLTFASKIGQIENISEIKGLSSLAVQFSGICAAEAVGTPTAQPDSRVCIIQIPQRQNSLDQCEEQTGRARSVDEADIDPAIPQGRGTTPTSRAFLSFH